MENGWIKLWRKTQESDLFLTDPTAWRVFEFLLLSAKKETGIYISGRFRDANLLRLKPITFYKALKRLEQKWHSVNIKSDNKKSTIMIVNWHKYQHTDNTISNITVTSKEQQSNTKQEYRIKNKNTITNVIGTLSQEIKSPENNFYIVFNETWKKVYGKNPTGGAVKTQYPVKRLVEAYGLEKVCGVLLWLESNRNTLRFAPVINNPLDLEQKWNSIVNAYQKENQPILRATK